MFLTGRTIGGIVRPGLLLVVARCLAGVSGRAVMSPGTGAGDNRWWLCAARRPRMGNRHLLSVEVVLVQRIFAANDELERPWDFLVDSRRNGDQG